MMDGIAADQSGRLQAGRSAPGWDSLPRIGRRGPGGARLFTATVVSTSDGATLQAFHASLARSEAEVAERLLSRFGPASAGAVIEAGFDPSAALVSALVAPAIIDALELVATDPGSALADGLDLTVAQRFSD